MPNMPNMPMRTALLLLLCSATLMACFPEPPDNDSGNNPLPPNDFNRTTFESQVLPALREGGCLGCHNAASPMGNFGLYSMPASSSESDENFTRVVRLVSTSLTADQAQMAKIYQKAVVAHSGSTPLSNPLVIENWIREGLGGAPIGGGGPDAGPGPDGGGGGGGAFDLAVFASDIQPILDGNGCTAMACHSTSTFAGGMGLTANAVAGSPESQTNLEKVLLKIDTTLPPEQAAMAKLFVKATTAHSGSRAVTDGTQRTTLENWIADGLMGQ